MCPMKQEKTHWILRMYLSTLAYIHCSLWLPMITLMMIISGLVSGLLFSQTSLVCKIVASLLYFLWFILDCSDGEVARFTKTFSNYGKQLDWVAHLICHPLLYIAIWIYFYNKGIIDMGFLSVVTMCFMSIEIIGRNLISLQQV